jgi:hypothetical protein
MAKRSLRPGDIIRVALGDEELGDKRPVLLCKVPNVQQARTIIALADRKSKSFDEQIDSLIQLAAAFVSDWENMPDPNNDGKLLDFATDQITTALGFSELAELAEVAVETFIPSSADKKKSELPHSSDAANSANPASVVVATL